MSGISKSGAYHSNWVHTLLIWGPATSIGLKLKIYMLYELRYSEARNRLPYNEHREFFSNVSTRGVTCRPGALAQA